VFSGVTTMTDKGNGGLRDVERRLEEALRNFAGNGLAEETSTDIVAGERIDKIGNLTSLAVLEASERTAEDIEVAGQAALNIANDIMTEAQQLATDLRANGKKMSEHLKEFARLTEKVSAAMRNTRAEVLNRDDSRPQAAVLPEMPNGETIQ
jgi:hypothetical protein